MVLRKFTMRSILCLILLSLFLFGCSVSPDSPDLSDLSDLSDSSDSSDSSETDSADQIALAPRDESLPAAGESESEKTYYEQFTQKYGLKIDRYGLLLNGDDTLYRILLENDIDTYFDFYASISYTTKDMNELNIAVKELWQTEIESSIAFLCEKFPERTEQILEEQTLWEESVVPKVSLAMDMLYDLDVYGTMHTVTSGYEVVSLYRERAFYLKYLQYVYCSMTNDCDIAALTIDALPDW